MSMQDTLRLFYFLSMQNVQAFGRVIRLGETCQEPEAYRWLFGSVRGNAKLFSDMSKHPQIRTYEKYDGQFIKNGKIDFTTAAGAYQITGTTYNGLCARWGFKDFTPRTQDLMMVALIEGRGALQDVAAGRFETAIKKLRAEWASLPGASHGDQPTIALAAAKKVYEQYGGNYAAA